MASTISSLLVALGLDLTGFKEGLGEAEKSTGSFSTRAVDGLSALGGGIVVGGLAAAGAGIAGLSVAMKDWVSEASAAQGVQAQTNAVLKSTGGISGMTADSVDKLATSFSEITPFEDDVIASAENMLLTFTNIGKDVFPGATQTVLDMSQALGQDLNSSAMQLGKALNDPIKGVTALQRVGVTFTEDQKKMIAEMVKSGDVMGAQKIILAELGREFGGSAVAAGQTFAGSWTILQNKMGNFKEALGTALFPALEKFMTILTEIANKPEVKQFLTDLATKIGEFALAAAEWLPKIAGWFQNAFTWLMENQGVIAAALAVIGSAIVAFAYTSLAAAIPTVIAFVTASWPVILVIGLIAAAAYLLYRAWTENWGGIKEKTAAVWDWLQPKLAALVDWFKVNIPIAIAKMNLKWGEMQNKMAMVKSWIDTHLMPLFRSVEKLVGTLLPYAIQGFQKAWEYLAPYIEQYVSGSLDRLMGLLNGIWSLIQTIAPYIADYVTWAFGNLTKIIDGVTQSVEWLIGALDKLRLPPGLDGLGGSMGAQLNAQVGGAGQAVVVNYYDQAVVSSANENEIADKLGPAIVNKLRKLGVL
jgi:hypothetical protein